VSKGGRQKEQARAKIARMRAEEARRRRRQRWIAAAGAAVLLIAAAVGISLAIGASSGGTSHGGTPHLRLASLGTLGPLRPAPPPGPAGPEGVPVPAAALLAGLANAAAGQPVDQIRCATSEQTTTARCIRGTQATSR
jgi:hypothetical protein